MNLSEKELKKTLSYRWVVWGILILAFMIVFFHRLAAGVVREDLTTAFDLSATAFGSLSSMYFYAYMIMQIPVGILADSLGARKTVTAGMMLAGAGSILFGLAPTTSAVFAGRFLVGIGVSTVFVSTMKVQSHWFREREFATMSGLTSLLGNLGGVFAQTPLALAVAIFTWRMTFAGIGAISIVLALMCYFLIRNKPQDMGFPPINEAQILSESSKPEKISLLKALRNVLSEWRTWPAFVFFFFFSGSYLVFAGTWGVSYLIDVYGMGKQAASSYIAFTVYGGMAGSFFAGWISDKVGLRKLPLLVMGALFSSGWGLLVFMKGGQPPVFLLKPLFFFMGFTAMSFVLSWAITKEMHAPAFTGMAISVVNTGGFLGPALLATFMGMVLDSSAELPAVVQYHRAFSLLFWGSLTGLACAFLLPETRCRNVYRQR